jgi:hypothetical protein
MEGGRLLFELLQMLAAVRKCGVDAPISEGGPRSFEAEAPNSGLDVRYVGEGARSL